MSPKALLPHRPPRLSEAELSNLVYDAAQRIVGKGERVLCVVPDGTRTLDLPFFAHRVAEALDGRASALDFVVALGTHPPLGKAELTRLFGLGPFEADSVPGTGGRAHPITRSAFFNHGWKDEGGLTQLGEISSATIRVLSSGALSDPLRVRINSRALDYDRLLVLGPVFPHEVAGFSGGNKYFFPGISGPEVIDYSHWIGALARRGRFTGASAVIGIKETAVRRLIDLASSMLPIRRSAICAVNDHRGCYGVFDGSPEEAWSAAADLAAETHVAFLEKPVKRAIAVLPGMYRDLWVGAKGMYKLDPVVADGGELVIYAPGLDRVSAVHGDAIREIGYHVLDYFTKRWERYKALPWGVLAHSTHLRGSGSWDSATGIETPRIKVTLSTALPRETCEELGLGWLDPAGSEIARLLAGEDGEALVVDPAGETLYRLEIDRH